ncbi:MAG TPA: septum formation initiator family protein [Candidatus Dormibacteraeota bacterium]|nr:septum formation initiator family protein [Candidatus Dormibacteraeota bacterium]
MSRRRTRSRKLPTRRLVYLAVLIGAALVGSAFVRVTLQDNALAREALAVRGQIAMLEAQQSYLQAQVATRETPEYIRQKAREFGYVQQGEGLASVRDGAVVPSGRTTGSDGNASVLARVQRWIALFFHP